MDKILSFPTYLRYKYSIMKTKTLNIINITIDLNTFFHTNNNHNKLMRQ